jgi:hypothetical protein
MTPTGQKSSAGGVRSLDRQRPADAISLHFKTMLEHDPDGPSRGCNRDLGQLTAWLGANDACDHRIHAVEPHSRDNNLQLPPRAVADLECKDLDRSNSSISRCNRQMLQEIRRTAHHPVSASA